MGHHDRQIGQLEAGVIFLNRRISPVDNIAEEDLGEILAGQL